MALLDISGLDYRPGWRSPWLFQGLSLSVAAGEMVQLTGGSGSGKTALTELITGWRKPAVGNIKISGPVSVVSQKFSLYSDLTVSENIEFFSRINDWKPEAANLLNWAGLSKWADTRAGRLPAGYWRLLQIAVAVHRDFSLIILDDADTGLDRDMQLQVIRMLTKLKDAGKGILMITSCPVADPAFDRMLVLRNGKVEKEDLSFESRVEVTS